MSVELFCVGFTSTCLYFSCMNPLTPRTAVMLSPPVLRFTRRAPFSRHVVRAPFVLEGHGKTSQISLALFINLVFLINHPFHKRFINCGQGERLYLCKSQVLGGRKYTQRFSYLDFKYNVSMKNILPLGNKEQILKAGHSEQRFYGFMTVQS